jgi:hypothetical protein
MSQAQRMNSTIFLNWQKSFVAQLLYECLKQQVAEEPQDNEEQTKAKFKRLKAMYYKAMSEGEFKQT